MSYYYKIDIFEKTNPIKKSLKLNHFIGIGNIGFFATTEDDLKPRIYGRICDNADVIGADKRGWETKKYHRRCKKCVKRLNKNV